LRTMRPGAPRCSNLRPFVALGSEGGEDGRGTGAASPAHSNFTLRVARRRRFVFP
jgi:hypothetical protein